MYSIARWLNYNFFGNLIRTRFVSVKLSKNKNLKIIINHDVESNSYYLSHDVYIQGIV